MICYQNVGKRYGLRDAVKNFSLVIPQGEFFGLLGPNGAGKTSVLRMTQALAAPSSGCIEIDGLRVGRSQNTVKQKLGIVPQHNNLEAELSARQNLEYHGMLYGMERRARQERIAELFEFAAFSERQHECARYFSGGQQRLLMIIKALMHNPLILLLDEPTSALDPQARRRIWTLLTKLNNAGLTVFLTTHYMEEAEALCGRVGFINKGEIAALGPPRDIVGALGTASNLEDVFIAIAENGGS